MSNQTNESNIISEKLKKVEELKEAGIEPYGRKYEKINNIEDVFHYLVKNYNLKRKKVYGKVLGFGKKFENKLINEYWNKKYITSDS